jgi:hypothetical protein
MQLTLLLNWFVRTSADIDNMAAAGEGAAACVMLFEDEFAFLRMRLRRMPASALMSCIQ